MQTIDRKGKQQVAFWNLSENLASNRASSRASSRANNGEWSSGTMHDENPLMDEQGELNLKNTEPVPAAAKRALEEAARRRALSDKDSPQRIREINGREGPDPVRYGDWEKKGIAVDF